MSEINELNDIKLETNNEAKPRQSNSFQGIIKCISCLPCFPSYVPPPDTPNLDEVKLNFVILGLKF